ncbi:hypothetical protein FQN57_003309 [Myotisia sp. PD_48]|nr:hypothetical protein FQN57_003309 [Myotisia sp. PD_48]
MRSAVAFVLLAAHLVSAVVVAPVDYTGTKVFRLPTEKKNVKEVQRIIDELHLDTWKYPKKAGANADIVVPAAQVSSFLKRIDGMNRVVMHEDLGKSIAKENTFPVVQAGTTNATWFNAYHSYQQHVTWLTDIQRQYPSNSEVVTVGTSHEGRQINAIHLWGKAKNANPAVIFHGTIHAREWISTMVVEYFIWQFLSGYGGNADITSILDKYDLWIVPIVNPDGFLYTQSRDRMWRKNRAPNSGSSCVGTDLNRNYPISWSGGGSSPDPCNETYRGRSASDTTEIKAHTAWMRQIASGRGVKLFIDWHSYSQLFLSPYAYSCSARPANDAKHQTLARAFASALRAVHGVSYRTGPLCPTLYQASGSSVDWAFDVLKAEISYTAELRDTGASGFILPPSQILPSGQETLAGLIALMKQL